MSKKEWRWVREEKVSKDGEDGWAQGEVEGLALLGRSAMGLKASAKFLKWNELWPGKTSAFSFYQWELTNAAILSSGGLPIVLPHLNTRAAFTVLTVDHPTWTSLLHDMQAIRKESWWSKGHSYVEQRLRYWLDVNPDWQMQKYVLLFQSLVMHWQLLSCI